MPGWGGLSIWSDPRTRNSYLELVSSDNVCAISSTVANRLNYPILTCSTHVRHMWDVGWEQIIRIISVPRLGLKLSALFLVYVSRWRWFWIMNIYVINIEWISWPPLLCKHKNAVALRSTRNCCFIGRFVLFMQLHYYHVGDTPQCCVFMHLKLHCCWTGRRLTQDEDSFPSSMAAYRWSCYSGSSRQFGELHIGEVRLDIFFPKTFIHRVALFQPPTLESKR